MNSNTQDTISAIAEALCPIPDYGTAIDVERARKIGGNTEIKKLLTLLEQFIPKWVSVEDKTPELIEGKNYSENVFAICNGEIKVMALCYIPGEDGGFLWGNCYGDINGDPEIDDDYSPTHWQPLPSTEHPYELLLNHLKNKEK